MLIFEQKNERVFSKTETGSGFEGLGGAPIHKLTCVFTIMTRGGSRIFLARGGGGSAPLRNYHFNYHFYGV